MEALNFSQPTQRHNGKAGGIGKGGEGLRCRNYHLHSLPPSCWSDNMLSMLHFETGKRGRKTEAWESILSAQFSQSSGQWGEIPLALAIWISMSSSPKRMVFWVIWVCQPECSAIPMHHQAPSTPIPHWFRQLKLLIWNREMIRFIMKFSWGKHFFRSFS